MKIISGTKKRIKPFYNFIFRYSFIAGFIYCYRFIKGFIFFKIHKKTPFESYVAMRQLYVLSNGRFNDFVSYLLSITKPKYKNIVADGILGNLDPSQVITIADEIHNTGYYISSQKLHPDKVRKIVEFARKTPSSYINLTTSKSQALQEERIIFNSDAPVSPIYRFDMQQIFENSDLVNLLLDQSLLAVAQEYLNCIPVLDLVSLWWSVPFHGKGTSEAAQEFHFDMDRIKFLKIFIYLTDVDTNNGPHCYVAQSHKRKPKALLSDGRKSDSEIEKYYLASDIHELCNTSGTIILADTRGFHKGKPLITGERLLFQIEYSNSLFGHDYPKVNLDRSLIDQESNNVIESYPYTYKQILSR